MGIEGTAGHVRLPQRGGEVLALGTDRLAEQRHERHHVRLHGRIEGLPRSHQKCVPGPAVQLCVIHQIRNTIKYVGSKHQKEFMRDLKTVYQAVNKGSAEDALEKLNEKWGALYSIVIKSWRDNWDKLSEYFQYTAPIRKLIYTTNTVGGQVRKVTKGKGVFTSNQTLEKLVCLAYRNIRKKWTMPVANWGQIAQQMAIRFGERFKLL